MPRKADCGGLGRRRNGRGGTVLSLTSLCRGPPQRVLLARAEWPRRTDVKSERRPPRFTGTPPGRLAPSDIGLPGQMIPRLQSPMFSLMFRSMMPMNLSLRR